MYNLIALVGRLVSTPIKEETESGTHTKITLAVPRSFKNMEGIYETDFIDCVLYNVIADRTCEYCQKGNIVGVKGRLQTRIIETEDTKKRIMELVAEKLTFLSSKKED